MMKQVHKASDVPHQPHYAVLVYKTGTVHHEGDERSRTNPGHGYPAYSEEINMFEHYITLDKAEWEDFIVQLINGRPYEKPTKNFVAFHVAGLAQVKTVVKHEIGLFDG